MLKLKSLLVTFALTIFSMTAIAESPMMVDGATTVDTDKAQQLFEQEVAFVDVRKDSDWEAGRIPGAIHIELKKKLTKDSLMAEVGPGDEVVFYCNGASCMRSSKATQKAIEWGYSKVYYYRNGFPAWKSASLPVE